MTDVVSVSVGDLRIRGGEGQDGFYFTPGGLDIVGGVGVRTSSVERMSGGAFPGRVWRTPRLLSLEGECVADSAEALGRYARLLTGVLGNGSEKPVVIHHPSHTLTGLATLDDSPEWEVLVWGKLARFQLPLRFRDPVFRGKRQAEQSGSSINLTNYGNAPYWPVITVSANASSVVLTSSDGKRFEQNSTVTTGAPLVIDMKTGVVRRNGVAVFGSTGRADVMSVRPGGSLTITTSQGTVSGFGEDAYI